MQSIEGTANHEGLVTMEHQFSHTSSELWKNGILYFQAEAQASTIQIAMMMKGRGRRMHRATIIQFRHLGKV